jgi:hypothetical protein
MGNGVGRIRLESAPKSMRLSDLPAVTPDNETVFMASTNRSSAKVSMESIVEGVKKSLGYLEKPLIKCSHCGQWGAAYCACRYCGAPIDPV